MNMKKLLINTLASIIFGIGYTCAILYIKLEGFYWYHMLLFIGAMLMTVPSVIFWINGLKLLFEKTKSEPKNIKRVFVVQNVSGIIHGCFDSMVKAERYIKNSQGVYIKEIGVG